MAAGRFRKLFMRTKMKLGDETRSLGSITAERKTRVLGAREQIIERKKLQKQVPQLQAEKARRGAEHQKYSQEREALKKQMEQLTNSIGQKAQQLKQLQQNTTDTQSSKRMGTASRQDEMATARDPHRVPKLNTLAQDITIRTQMKQAKALQKEITKLQNKHKGLMVLFDELNGHTRQAETRYARAESQLALAEEKLKRLTN